jgi:hypothetical protein
MNEQRKRKLQYVTGSFIVSSFHVTSSQKLRWQDNKWKDNINGSWRWGNVFQWNYTVSKQNPMEDFYSDDNELYGFHNERGFLE